MTYTKNSDKFRYYILTNDAKCFKINIDAKMFNILLTPVPRCPTTYSKKSKSSFMFYKHSYDFDR